MHLLKLYLAVAYFYQAVSSAQLTTGRFLPVRGPILLNVSFSSETLIGVQSKLNCLSMCQARACHLAVFIKSNLTCQLVALNSASHALTSTLVGNETGAKLWTVEDFQQVLQLREANTATTKMSTTVTTTVPNIILNFLNTNTGRNGSIQQTVISFTGCYRIEVAGARGGYQTHFNMNGGRGADVKGNFNLTAGTQISIVVGQMGGPTNSRDAGAGGGGGSFVYVASESRLLIAAGGGGGASSYTQYYARPGEAYVNGTNSNGTSSSTSAIGLGGINGQPGYNIPSNTSPGRNHGGCGAGWFGKAVNPRRSTSDGDRGGSLADGWVGGQAGGVNTGHGGFGGGGGGGETASSYGGAAGAGGGYSGGGAGLSSSHAGGGGGSYCGGLNCSAQSGGNTLSDHGFVVLRTPC